MYNNDAQIYDYLRWSHISPAAAKSFKPLKLGNGWVITHHQAQPTWPPQKQNKLTDMYILWYLIHIQPLLTYLIISKNHECLFKSYPQSIYVAIGPCMGSILPREISQTSSGNRTWISNYIHVKQWGIVAYPCLHSDMMTSLNRNIFSVTGPLCGEITGCRWIPLTKASDAQLWCFLWSAPEQTVE